MKKTTLNIFLFLSLTLFILSFSIQLTIDFKPLFVHDTALYSSDEATNLPTSVILKNYNELMSYLKGATPTLQLQNFYFSPSGKIHFAEVRYFFRLNLVLLIISFIILVPCYILSVKFRHINTILYSSLFTISITVILCILFSFFFNTSFVLFHKILFRNEFWLMDPRVDPIINIFPENFFLHCGIFGISISILLSIGFLISYIYLKKHIFKTP